MRTLKIYVLIVLCIVLQAIAQTPEQTTPEHSRTVVLYSDSQTNHDVHRAVVTAIDRINPAVVFHAGDMVGDGLDEADWDSFFVITAPLLEKIPFYPALGNHEKDSPLFYEKFELPGNEQWYSVMYDSVKFIILNSNAESDKKSEQYRWLEAELKSTGAETIFTVAVFHHSPYSGGQHKPDSQGLRKSWVPLFKKYGVDLVFGGHDHIYERSRVDGIYYIVAGGGGGNLYDQENDNLYSQVFHKKHCFCRLQRVNSRLEFECLDTQLNRLDYFEIE